MQPDNLTAVSSACHEAASSKILVNTSVCDVTDKSQVQDGIARADELASNDSSLLSSVASILVNCAGITRDSKISNLSIDDWEDVINVNLKGTFLMCQAFCRTDRLTSLLKNSDKRAVGGSIINIGSIVMQYGNIGQVNYAASKGGVVGLTRSLAKEMALFSSKLASSEVADKGAEVLPPTIRVNCIQPGEIAMIY